MVGASKGDAAVPKPPALADARAEDFFIPGRDPGLALVGAQDTHPQKIPPVQTGGLALATDVEQRLRLLAELNTIDKVRTWRRGVVFPTLLAVAEDVDFVGKHMSVCGKYLINSAGGARLRNHYAGVAPARDGVDADAALVAHFAERSFGNRALPRTDEDLRHLPFVMQSRNFFNFYHFTKETLPLLTMVERHGLTGPVLIVTGSGAEVKPFVRDQIATWFPAIADRVEIVRAPSHYDRALVALDTRYFYYQCRDRIMPSLSDLADPPVPRRATMGNVWVAAMNSYEGPLADLREQVLRQAPPATGRRVYVKRRSVRNRRVVGAEALEQRLLALGFEIVFFEDMTVAEQVACVRGAECLVSLHGAGLANMLFAPEGALVVELSNLQTLLKRYGDFNPLALAAGVRYLHIFLNHDFDDPAAVPSISADGHRGVVLTAFEADVIAARIAATLNPEAAAAALAACRALNDAGRRADLHARLLAETPLLAHEADWHVWMANCAGDDKPQVLSHLRRAMVLAPRRIPLLRRTMTLAQTLGDRQTFLEATACFMRCAPQKAEDFLRDNGWGIEDDIRPASIAAT